MCVLYPLESGSASEGEEGEERLGGVASESSPWQRDEPSETEPAGNPATSDPLATAQSLFGEES